MIAAPAMLHARLAAMTFAGMALLVFSGCASTAQQTAAQAGTEPVMAPPSRSTEVCMFSVVVKDWAGIDKQRFIIYGLTQSEAYLGTLFFPTPDLINNLGMAVVDSDHNGRICGMSSDYVEFRNATIPGRNLITSLHRISEEEAKALLEQSKPKPKEKKAQEEKAPAEPAPPQ